MTASLLLGFADTPQLSGLPDGFLTTELGSFCAISCTAEGVAPLPEISGKLLKLQSQAAIVPLRPHPMPNNLTGQAARLEGQLRANFDQLGHCVEFVVEMKLAEEDPAETAENQLSDSPADYLRRQQYERRAYQAACEAMRDRLKSAIKGLEAAATATKLGERNVKGFAAIHYLMNRDFSSEAVAQWQASGKLLADIPATLTGPWAPYSFVSLDI